MEILDIIRNRRTIRSFSQKPVTTDDLKLMIEMAKWKLLKLPHSAKIRNDATSWLNWQGVVPHASAPAWVRQL